MHRSFAFVAAVFSAGLIGCAPAVESQGVAGWDGATEPGEQVGRLVVRVELDVGRTEVDEVLAVAALVDVDGDGFGLSGSFEVAENWHIIAGYNDLGLDFGVDLTDLGDPVSLDSNIRRRPVRQCPAFDNQIEHQRSPLLNGTIRAAGTSARRDMTISARMDRK